MDLPNKEEVAAAVVAVPTIGPLMLKLWNILDIVKNGRIANLTHTTLSMHDNCLLQYWGAKPS